ncbi:MAG: lipopolysaccharide biosynthesis protein [Muribaculaceae bacterium]|nr:lipopolysaccharide biosynthesis protein [Muribaculaceae bacterium]
MGELRKKALKGVFWSSIDKVCVKAVAFIVSIVIARILSPADYGIIGMILVFITIANIFINSGISQALVQRKNRTATDMATAFYFNVSVALICYIILFFTAPYIAEFYEVIILTPVLRILGLNIIVSSFATVQRANLLVLLDFRSLAIVNIVGVLVSSVIGIWMAYAGYGVWALVGQQMSSIVASTVMFWISGKWHPTARFSMHSFKILWSFGSKLLATGLVATTLREVYTVAIGKVYRSSELGFYTRAVQTSDMVAMTTNDVINAVTFPILSSLQDDRSKLIEVYRRMLGMTAFCIFPIMIGLAVVASPFISLLLTDKWLPTVPLLQWLCVARMFTPISSLNMNILNAIGRSDLFMKVDFAKIPLIVLAMVITIPMGVEAIVIGNVVTTIISYFINAYLPGKIFNFGVKAQFKIFWKITLATIGMALCVWGSMLMCTSELLKLLIGILTGLTAYLIFTTILRVSELAEITQIVANRLSR